MSLFSILLIVLIFRVCLDKMDVPDPVALLDPEDSLELWDSPDPKEPA